MNVEATPVEALTTEQCLEEIQAEPNRNILLALVDARRKLRRMHQGKNTGRLEIFINNGFVETVVAPDASRIPKE